MYPLIPYGDNAVVVYHCECSQEVASLTVIIINYDEYYVSATSTKREQ